MSLRKEESLTVCLWQTIEYERRMAKSLPQLGLDRITTDELVALAMEAKPYGEESSHCILRVKVDCYSRQVEESSFRIVEGQGLSSNRYHIWCSSSSQILGRDGRAMLERDFGCRS